MLPERNEKRPRLRAPCLLAVLFLLYIGYVGLHPLAKLYHCTKSVLTAECPPSDYIDAVDELYSGMLSTEQNQALLQNKGTYINLNGFLAKLLGQPMMNKRVTLKNGHLSEVNSHHKSQEEIEATARNIASLAQAQKQNGRQFLFVMTPSQISKYEDLLPAGYTDTTNETVDALLALLAQKGVACLDLRECMHAEGITQADAFYTTDHHWNPQTGLWAYARILQTLDRMGCISPVDPDFTDADRFEIVTFENTFLGTSGRRTGIYYAGLDDSIFLIPKFDTALTVTIPNLGLELTGRYEDVAYRNDEELDFDNPDYFQYSAYSLYGWGDRGLIQWRNENAPDNARVMLIGDSMGNIPFSLMSLFFTSCDELDMRYYSGDFSKHFSDYQPDIIIMEASPGQALAPNTQYPYVPE